MPPHGRPRGVAHGDACLSPKRLTTAHAAVRFPRRLAWKSPRTLLTIASRQRLYESRCGRFRVVWSRCLFGPRKGPQAILDVWYACHLEHINGRPVWSILSKHRKRAPAFAACERHGRVPFTESDA